jgi:diguanylate cyclase (GGDEF) domain
MLWGIYVVLSVCSPVYSINLFSPAVSFLASFYILGACVRDRRFVPFWFPLGLCTLSWGIAESLWSFVLVFLNADPEQDVLLRYLYLLPNIFLLSAFISLVLRERRRWLSLQFITDLLAIFASVTGFLYFAFFKDQFRGLLARDSLSITAFVSLLSDMMILTFGMLTLLQLRRFRFPLSIKLLLSGVILYVLSDIFYVYEVFNHAYVPNTLIDVLYVLSFVLVGSAGISCFYVPVSLGHIHRKLDGPRGTAIRSLILLWVPVLAVLIRRMEISEIMFFLFIILAHQLVSQGFNQLQLRDLALEEKCRQAENLEAIVAERTRELRVMNQTLENLSKRDAITGQFDRKYLMERIEELIRSAGPDQKIWLIILDFNRFKTINDSYGHDIGDQVLRIIGRKLETVSDERTFFGRLGGDEFGLVCLRSPHEIISPLLHTVSDLCEVPVSVESFTVHVGVSIGVATWPDDALTRSDLMRHADIAMYMAKRKRQSSVSFFDIASTAGVERSHQIDLALKQSNISADFRLCYQPQFTVDGHRLIGMEALVRWNAPELGFVAPDEFIPVAEENGFIIPLSDWILKEALARISDWNARYSSDYLMGINISPLQLDEVDFLSKLEAALDEARVLPSWVNLEMTERCAMKDESFILGVFDRLAKLNITISIDDFGTGYSAISYLKKFNINYLKIAKQLVDDISVNENEAQIVQAIIMMASAMKLRTIAEGVEYEDQLLILEALGCDEIQGYYFGKPASPDEFEELYLKPLTGQ